MNTAKITKRLRATSTSPRAGSVLLIRSPELVLQLHRHEGWGRAEAFAIMESSSRAVRVIMADGRSGDVVFDRVPNNDLSRDEPAAGEA